MEDQSTAAVNLEALDRPQLFNNTTRFLALVVAILGIISYQVSQSEQSSIVERKRVFLKYGFDADDFVKIGWVRGPGLKEKLVFRKYQEPVNDRSWEMLEPYQETAEGTLIRQIFQLCSYMDYIEKVPVYSGNVEELGLTNPLLVVQMQRADGSQIQFRVGQAMSKLKSHAILFSDQKHSAYLITDRLIQKFLQPMSAYRNQDLFQPTFSKLTELEVQLNRAIEGIEPQSLSFMRDLAFWRVAGEKPEFVNVAELEELYKKVDGLVVAQTLSEFEWTDETRKKHKIDSPLLKLRLKTEKSEQIALIGAKFKDHLHYLQFGDRKTVYLTDIQDLLERLLKPQSVYLSNQLLPIANSAIETLKIEHNSQKFELFRDLRNWKLRRNPEAELDQDKSLKLLGELLRSEITQFSVKNAPKFEPQLKLTMKTSLVTREIVVGQAFSGENGEKSAKTYLVKRKSVPGVAVAKIKSLSSLKTLQLDLRRPEILNFDKFGTSKIELVDANGKVIRVLTKSQQKFLPSDLKLSEVNEKAVATYVGFLALFRAKRFISLKSESGLKKFMLAPPQFQLKIYSSVWDAESRSQKPKVAVINVGEKISNTSYAAAFDAGDVIIEIDNVIVDAMRHGFAK